MRNNEQLLRNLAKAEKVNNILGIAMVAEEASREAIDFALETMLEGEDLRAMQEYADHAGEAAGSRVWKDGGMFFDATAQATPNEEYRANPSLVDEIKSKLPEFWKGAVDMVVKAYERYIQSAEGALGQTSNELRAILMKEVWQQSMSVQFFRNTLAPCANAFDERMSKMSKAQRTAELKEWRKWHADLGTGAKGCRERASQFIKDKLGIKAQQAWDDAMNLLDGNEAKYKEYLKDPSKNSMGFLYKGVKNLLIEAGIPADVLKTSNIFFPMEVKDYKGFTQDFFGHSVTYNFVDKERARIAKEYKKKVGKKNEKTGEYEITDAQEAELQLRLTDAINSNFQRKATDENRVTAFYRRTMQDYSKNPDMLKYYNDVFSTLDKYMDAVYRTVMMRNLIGKTDVTQNASDLYQQILNETDDKKAHGKIGMYLASLPLGRVSEDAMTNIMEKMRQLALRSKSDPKELFNFVRQVNQFTTLGSPLNALNQIQDLEFSLLLFGIQPTIEAVTKVLYKDKGAARLSEVGLETANEAYRVVDDNTLGRITKLVYSKTGFEWADRFGKEVTINAATIWAQKVVKEHLKNPSKETSRDWTELKYWLNECWPEPDYALLEAQGASEAEISQAREVWSQKRNALLTDLAEGKVTPDTKYLQWYMLTKLQPQNAATVPGLYNTSTAFGKTMYQFSTVFLRQLGFLGDYFKMKYKTQGSRAAFEAAARFIGFALMVGVPKEMIESILKGQTPQLGQSSLLSIGHVLALNSYTMSVIKNEGIFRGAISWTQPSFAALDNVSRDAMRAISLKSYKGYTFKSVPIAGMFIWYWALGGRQQSIKNGVALFHSPSTASEMKEIQRQAASSLAEMEGKENAE